MKPSRYLIATALFFATPIAFVAQSTTPGTSTTQASLAKGKRTPSAVPRKTAHRRHRSSTPGVQVIRRETAPPTPSTSPNAASETPAQRAQDQRLLKKQQSQSADAEAINTRIVQQAQQRQQQQQNEVRIQDAPGPAQTTPTPTPAPSNPPQP